MSQPSDEQPAAPPTPERRGERLREFGAALGLSPQAVRRARIQLLVLAPLFAGVILVWDYREELFGLAAALPAGSTELMCHPGHWGDALRSAPTRLKESRERELAALTAPEVREAIERHSIELVNFAALA